MPRRRLLRRQWEVGLAALFFYLTTSRVAVAVDVATEAENALLEVEVNTLKEKGEHLKHLIKAEVEKAQKFEEIKSQIEKMNPEVYKSAETALEEKYMVRNLTVRKGDIVLPKNEQLVEEVKLMGMFFVMALMFVLPLLWPLRRVCEKCYHKVYPIILLLNTGIFAIGMNHLYLISVNTVFYRFVRVFNVVVDKIALLLQGSLGIIVLATMWKFKDRILEAMGIENAAHYIGEPRDWCTLWSMRRFAPIELFIWKVEGLPSTKIHTSNDIFIEVTSGYNVNMRTRVHNKVGHICSFKESIQLNFDPFDSGAVLNISVKNQEVVGATEIGSVHLGATQVNRLKEPNFVERYIGWGTVNDRSEASIWAASRFSIIDLVPTGRIYLRLVPVEDEIENSFPWCCCPRRERPQSSV